VRSKPLPPRCPPGRSARMLPKAEETMVEVGREAAGGATITNPKVAAEDMTEDMETGEVEEEEEEEEEAWGVAAAAEGERCRAAGTVVEEGEAVTTRATIKMLGIKGEEGEVATEEEVEVEEEEEEVVVVEEEEGTTQEASRTLATMEEQAVTMTTTNKMEAGIRREEGVEEVAGAGEEEAEQEKQQQEQQEQQEVEDGEGEGGRVLTKEDSLNSSSNMAGSTTTKLALIKADTTLVEDPAGGFTAESTQRLTPYNT